MSENQPMPVAKKNIWRGLIAQQKNSGMTIAVFCKSRGLNYHTFHYWQKKFARGVLEPSEPMAGQFIAIATRQSLSSQKARIILPNGVQVDLGGGLETVAVQQFLQNLCGVNNARS